MVPEPALVDRFRSGLRALIEPGARLGVAVSGGSDSLALLLLAAAARPGHVEAATVDHGFRPEARDEAEAVAAVCERLAVPHAILTARWTEVPEAAIQERARGQRYRLLGYWAEERALDAIATGHHADDQAETLLMRLARGSGVRGLAGMRPRSITPGAHVRLLRPLLGWRRAELGEVCACAGLQPAADPSNRDERFERVRVRQLLAAEPWLDPLQLANAAAHAAEVDSALADLADRLWQHHVTGADDGTVRVALPDVPRELRRRVARRAIDQVRSTAAIDRPAFDMASNIESLLDALEQGKSATQGGVLAAVKRGIWHFKPAPPRRSH